MHAHEYGSVFIFESENSMIYKSNFFEVPYISISSYMSISCLSISINDNLLRGKYLLPFIFFFLYKTIYVTEFFTRKVHSQTPCRSRINIAIKSPHKAGTPGIVRPLQERSRRFKYHTQLNILQVTADEESLTRVRHSILQGLLAVQYVS